MLNEHQATLLLTFMNNSERVMDFKEALVAEFFRMREALSRRERDLWQQMQAVIAKEVESKVRASFGSHLMLERKREIPMLDGERVRREALQVMAKAKADAEASRTLDAIFARA